jgi:putative transposase
MAEHVALKKECLGNSDRGLGSIRHAGPDRVFRPALVGEDRNQRRRFIEWLAITGSKFYSWRERYGKMNEHKRLGSPGLLAGGLGEAGIVGFRLKNRLGGYRRLTFMMLDADIVAVSPSSIWRVLSQAAWLAKWKGQPSNKGTGFEQSLTAHQHWHIDVSYLNASGTFYDLGSILDGYSRYIVHWDLREKMTDADIEIIPQRAKEKYPEARPRIISDNGLNASEKFGLGARGPATRTACELSR